jgi:mRNA interferase MazF
MAELPVSRGQIWWVDVGLAENKRFVVVSNNARNRQLQDVLGVRLTTADKPDIPSIVEFGPGEVGDTRCFAVADDIWLVRKDWLRDRVGALTSSQMERVGQALLVALDIPSSLR